MRNIAARPWTGPRGGTTTISKSGLLRKTVYFYPDEWEALRKLAHEQERGFAEIVREAVRDYLQLDDEKEEPI